MSFLDNHGLSSLWNKIQDRLATKADSSHDHTSISGTAENVTGVVGIDHGGTGATTAEEALAALGGMSRKSDAIELGQNLNNSSNYGGYIDFHFNGSTSDYTSRIIESTQGRLTAISDFDVKGWLQCSNGLWIAGGGFYASNNNNMIYGTALPSAGTQGRIFFKKV